jgi:hypothetical protein
MECGKDDTIPDAFASEKYRRKNKRSNPLICVDDFNAAKRFSTVTVNTAQRRSTHRINGFQPNSTLKSPLPKLSCRIVGFCPLIADYLLPASA